MCKGTLSTSANVFGEVSPTLPSFRYSERRLCFHRIRPVFAIHPSQYGNMKFGINKSQSRGWPVTPMSNFLGGAPLCG